MRTTDILPCPDPEAEVPTATEEQYLATGPDRQDWLLRSGAWDRQAAHEHRAPPRRPAVIVHLHEE